MVNAFQDTENIHFDSWSCQTASIPPLQDCGNIQTQQHNMVMDVCLLSSTGDMDQDKFNKSMYFLKGIPCTQKFFWRRNIPGTPMLFLVDGGVQHFSCSCPSCTVFLKQADLNHISQWLLIHMAHFPKHYCLSFSQLCPVSQSNHVSHADTVTCLEHSWRRPFVLHGLPRETYFWIIVSYII